MLERLFLLFHAPRLHILGVLTRHSLHFDQNRFPEDTDTAAAQFAVETILINVNIQSKKSYSYGNIHPQVLLYLFWAPLSPH